MQSQILVIRFGSLGDVILTTATVLNLKLAYPDSRLVYLTKERFRPVVELIDGVDEIATVSNDAGVRELAVRLNELDGRGFDTVVDLHGNFRSWLARSLITANTKCVYPKRRVERWRATRKKKTLPAEFPHTIDLYNTTLEQLGQGGPCRRPLLRRPPLNARHDRLFDTERRAILIAPGAAHATKAWPMDRFTEAAHALHSASGVRILWAITSAEKRSLACDGLETGPDIIELVDYPVAELAAIAARCSLAVTNDSGIGHLASAVGVPTLALFGPTHPVLGFAPRGLRDRVLQVDEFCRPCSRHGRTPCYRDRRYCFTRISANDLVETAVDMLSAASNLTRALFVDRDGTLIVNKHYLSDPGGVELIAGSAEALRSADAMGYRIVIVSNQSGVARGYHSVADVERVNARLLELLAAHRVKVAGMYYCPHHAGKGVVPEYARACHCRKPATGMAEQAALDLGLDLRRSWVVGDSRADLGLGRAIGGRSVLVRTGYGAEVERRYGPELEREAIAAVDDLRGAVRLLSTA